MRWWCVAIGLLSISLLAGMQQRRPVSFTKEVQPLLLKRCALCHGEKKAEHNLRLDSYEAIMQGDKDGPVIVPGKSGESRLFLVVAGKREPKMPPDPLPPLTPLELDVLRRWIDEGAKNDASTPPPAKPLFPALGVAPKPQRLSVPVAVAGLQANQKVEAVAEFGPLPALSAIAFTPNGKTLAVGGYKEVVLWDLTEGKLAKRWGISGLDGSVTALAFTPDGAQLAVAGGAPQQPAVIAVLNTATGNLIHRFNELRDSVFAVAFSPDGKWLTAAGADRLAYVWDMQSGKLAATLKEHGDWIFGVAFSSDGKWLATSSADRIVRICRIGDWKVVHKLEHPETTYRLAFQPHDHRLAVAVGGLSARGIWVWNAENGQHVRTIGSMTEPVLDVAWSADGKHLVAAVADNTVRLYDANGNQRAVLQGHNDWVNAVTFHPDGQRFASAGNDGTVRLWHVNGQALAILVQLAPNKDDWLILTPQGYFAASIPSALRWQATGLTVATDRLTQAWHNAGIVRKALAGEKIEPAPLP